VQRTDTPLDPWEIMRARTPAGYGLLREIDVVAATDHFRLLRPSVDDTADLVAAGVTGDQLLDGVTVVIQAPENVRPAAEVIEEFNAAWRARRALKAAA
jgi:hypothetical protein